MLEPAGRVDFLVGDRLVVEVDGHAFHASPAQRSEDLRRDAERHRAGYLVLRFSFEQVVHRRAWWLGVVADVLGRRWTRTGRRSLDGLCSATTSTPVSATRAPSWARRTRCS